MRSGTNHFRITREEVQRSGARGEHLDYRRLNYFAAWLCWATWRSHDGDVEAGVVARDNFPPAFGRHWRISEQS